MNVNENVFTFGRGRGKGRQIKVIPIQRSPMGPPKQPAPKRKERSSSVYTSNSSNINWRTQLNSAQGNSTTARTSSSSRSHSSSEPESRIVIALSEGRGEAIGEVGIAAINIARPSLILCQISDSQSYIKTLTKINILNPSEIVIPLTFIQSLASNRLIEKVKEQFQNVKITGVTRNTFNKNNGLQYVKQLCMSSMNSVIIILQHKYYALAAAAALLTYLETSLYVIYAKETVKIEYQESEDSTIIDVATADRLELVACARPTMKKRFSCLLDVLNHCQTKIGARTLRASILQPPCSVPVIEARLDCVTELVEHTNMLAAIQVILLKLTNIDQLLTLATVLPDQAQSCSERQINYILLLNTALEQIAPLRDVFENSNQPFFVELRTTLENPAFAEIKDLVRTLIHTDAHPGKGQGGMFQRCFAIKSGLNSLLDLVRKSYSERLEEMRKYVTALGEKHSLTLTLNNNHKKGYHIVFNLNAHQKKTLKKSDLPEEFIQVERLANSFTMKTQELIALSSRIEDIMVEILKMSNIMIYKLLLEIREHVGIFYKLCEDIAKLDMLQSLAKASSAMHYVRPQFADYLEVLQARHPLLDFLCSVEPTANSIFATKDYNMNIITGPNGSGKSIFIRQVVLIQVMAQVGCYVPAQSATLRVSNRILARVYLEDNMDCGASAFVLEMKEIQYFLTVLTDNTLIIIDELCRSTSVEEGTALAMAICEKLMKTPAFVFFTTHFKLLAKLEDLYFNVKTWQLETLTETVDSEMILHFTYNVIPGVTSLEHYGIFLAKGSWPANIIKYAEEVLEKLSRSYKQPKAHVEQVSAAARAKYNVEAELRILKAKKQLTRKTINEKLVEYQRNLQSLGYYEELLQISEPATSKCDGPDMESFRGSESSGYNNLERLLNHAEVIPDYCDSQGQCSYSAHQMHDMDNVSQNLNQNQEISHVFRIQNDDSDRGFQAPIRRCSNNFEEGSIDNQQKHFSNVPIFRFQNEYPVLFSDNPNNTLNDSAISERVALLQSPGTNYSQNLSYPNIFEPEVILETNGQQLNYSSVPNSFVQQNFVFQTKSTVIQQETIFAAQENFFKTSFPGNFREAAENSVVSQARLPFHQGSAYEDDSVVSRRSSVLSRDEFFTAEENSFTGPKENITIFSEENVMEPYQLSYSAYKNTLDQSLNSTDEFVDKSYNFRKSDTSIAELNDNKALSLNHNASLLSITEQQFSLPLQLNIERTSTPILIEPKSHSQPVPLKRNQNSQNFDNSQAKLTNKTAQDVFATPTTFKKLKSNDQLAKSISVSTTWGKDNIHGISRFAKTPEANKQSSKSTTTSSDSIKWGASNAANLFAIPPVVKTPSASKQQSEASSDSAGTKSILNPDSINTNWATNNMLGVSPFVKTSKANKQQSEFTTTSSDSIKWGASNAANLFAISSIGKTPTASKQQSKAASSDSAGTKSSSNQDNVCATSISSKSNGLQTKSTLTSSDGIKWTRPEDNHQAAHSTKPLAAFSENNSSSSNMNFKTSSDSVRWTMEKNTNRLDAMQARLEDTTDGDGLKNVSNSCYSDAEITEIINDLQSCSEYFSDSHDWDYVDEEVNAKLKQQTTTVKDQQPTTSTKDYQQTAAIENLEEGSLLIEHIHQTDKASDKNNKNQTKKKLKGSSGTDDQFEKYTKCKVKKDQYMQKKAATLLMKRKTPLRSKKSHITAIKTKGKTVSKLHIKRTKVVLHKVQKYERGKVAKTLFKDDKNTSPVRNKKSPDKKHKIPEEECRQLGSREFHCSEDIYYPLQNRNLLQLSHQVLHGGVSTDHEEHNSFHQKQSDREIAFPRCDERSANQQVDEIVHLEHHEDTHQAQYLEQSTQANISVQFEDIQPVLENKAQIDTEVLHSKHGESFVDEKNQSGRNELYWQHSCKEKPHNEEVCQLRHEEDSSEVHYNEKKSQPHESQVTANVDLENLKNESHDVSENRNTDLSFSQNHDEPLNESHLNLSGKKEGAFQNNPFSTQPQDELVQIKESFQNGSSNKVGTDENHTPLQDVSLEPLGDIHLELFSDESLFCESQNQTKEICSSNKKLLQTDVDSNKDTLLVGNSKKSSDCDDVIISVQSQFSPQSRDQAKYTHTTDEFETAHSILNSQDSVFFSTSSNTKQESLSKANGKKRQKPERPSSPRKSKRRRLGYISRNLNIPPTPQKCSSSIQDSTENQQTYNKGSPNVAQNFSATKDTSQTPSVCESSTSKPPRTKKPKWNPPYKTDSTDAKAKAVPKKELKSKIPKFKPPRKLTKKEIELAFYEQDKKILESDDPSQYLVQIMNRPSIKQLQQAKHIASIHKTDAGVMVVPTKQCKPRTRRGKFVTPLKRRSEDFDISLFSDKNSEKFEQFMNNSGKKMPTARQDAAYQVIESQVVSKEDCNKENAKSDENSSSKGNKSPKIKILQNIQLVSTSTEIPKNEDRVQTKGYYTQNKQCIDNIVDKYLKPETADFVVQKELSQEFDSHFFSQSTVSFEGC